MSSVALAGCGGGGSGTDLRPGTTVEGFEFTGESEVAEGEAIDTRFTCDGENVSPALAWTGAPDGAKQLALVLEDPDAPGGTFTHWLLYGIDPLAPGLREGLSGWTGYGPGTGGEGKNDFGDIGYGGPCPPSGEKHHYVFRLLALHNAVDLEQGVDRGAFDEAVTPHLLAEAWLRATYARP